MCIEKMTLLSTLIKNVMSIFKSFKRKNKKDSYYFEDYNKKVYIKANGNGVVVNTLKLVVNKPSEVDGIIRTFDISDAKKQTEFPDFETLMEVTNDAFFKEYGFWYTSTENIVTDVKLYYDEDNKKKKDNKKFLSFKLLLDPSAIEVGKVYKITFALSVPGLYPIENGRFDGSGDEHKNYGDFCTSLSTRLNFKKLTYSIYLDTDIVLSKAPMGSGKGINSSKKEKTLECVYKNNMFYKKYSLTLDNPREYDKISLRWDLKNQKN